MKQISFFQYLNRVDDSTKARPKSKKSFSKTSTSKMAASKTSKTTTYNTIASTKKRSGTAVLKQSLKTLSIHGGASTKGKRKVARPLSEKKWTHLILKSHKAKAAWSLLTPKNKIFIEKTISEKAKKFHVKVDRLVNVGNHLHLKCKARRENFQKFLKAITSLIARFVTGAKRGQKKGKFWQGLAFTRVLKSYFEEKNLNKYLEGNEIEALFGKLARESFLKDFNQWIYRARKLKAQQI